MSEHHINVVRLGTLAQHPNADTLSVTKVYGGYPAIVRSVDFREGDLAVYIPVDAVCPTAHPRFAFLGEHGRIRARKLRGVFSMGLLLPAEPGMKEGDDVAEAWGITRYEAPEPSPQNEADPGIAPVYDIEGWRRYIAEDPPIFAPDEEVVATEKLEGENARYAWHLDRLWCGSHTGWKRRDAGTAWWEVGNRLGLAERLSAHPDIVLFGEIVGHVPRMNYGATGAKRGLYLFDAMEVKTRRYLDYDEFVAFAAEIGVPVAPLLYRGPFDGLSTSLAEGPTTIKGSSHIREGFVVRPVIERQDPRIGRAALKLKGEDYLTRNK